MIMIDWVSIVRHSSRRFSVLNFAGGGRQRRGGNFHAPKTHHHKSMPSPNATDSLSQSDEKISSTCCFSNVRIYWIFLLIDMFELNCLRCSQAFFLLLFFLLSEIYTFLMLIWWYFFLSSYTQLIFFFILMPLDWLSLEWKIFPRQNDCQKVSNNKYEDEKMMSK